MSRAHPYTGRPTPKAVEARIEADQKRGRPVYYSVNALARRRSLDGEIPSPTEHPRDPEE